MEILDFIRSIRESFGASIAVYRFGNCYQFYEILKQVYPEAEAFYDGNHVWTKIAGRYYDIMGEKVFNIEPTFVQMDDNMIIALQVNKWTEKRREDYNRKIRSNTK